MKKFLLKLANVFACTIAGLATMLLATIVLGGLTFFTSRVLYALTGFDILTTYIHPFFRSLL